MTLQEVAAKLRLTTATEKASLDGEVTGGYAGDLLSDVLAHASPGDLWLTLQTHPSIVGVSVTKELAGVVIVNDRRPEDRTLEKAEQAGIPVLRSSWPTFRLAGALYALGIGPR